jgi:hypothetical protein
LPITARESFEKTLSLVFSRPLSRLSFFDFVKLKKPMLLLVEGGSKDRNNLLVKQGDELVMVKKESSHQI